MAKKTHIKVRMVPGQNPIVLLFTMLKNQLKGKKQKIN